MRRSVASEQREQERRGGLRSRRLLPLRPLDSADLASFFEAYFVRLPERLETLFMQCRTLYSCYKFLEARTFPSDGTFFFFVWSLQGSLCSSATQTLIVATGASRETGVPCPVRNAMQIPVPRSGPVLNGNILCCRITGRTHRISSHGKPELYAHT